MNPKMLFGQINQVTLEIKDSLPTITMHSILVRLKSSDFSKSLAKKLAKTMIKLLAWSTKFINMEEVKVPKR